MSEHEPIIFRKGDLFVIPASWWKRRLPPRPEPAPEVAEAIRRGRQKRIREYLERKERAS